MLVRPSVWLITFKMMPLQFTYMLFRKLRFAELFLLVPHLNKYKRAFMTWYYENFLLVNMMFNILSDKYGLVNTFKTVLFLQVPHWEIYGCQDMWYKPRGYTGNCSTWLMKTWGIITPFYLPLCRFKILHTQVKKHLF